MTSAQKRRTRRKRLHAARAADPINTVLNTVNLLYSTTLLKDAVKKLKPQVCTESLGKSKVETVIRNNNIQKLNMSAKESRNDVLAAREAKKLAKQKAKHKGDGSQKELTEKLKKDVEVPLLNDPNAVTSKEIDIKDVKQEAPKSKDVVDRATVEVEGVEDNQKSRDQVKAERAAKKAAKQSKKKGDIVTPNLDMTVKDVAETLKDIKNVAKDMQNLTVKVSALNFEANKVPLINLGFLLSEVCHKPCEC